MNDREFIELLNLYVDREITTADALRLEAEVSARPERRKIYDQYCRMQRACSLLAEEGSEFAGQEADVVSFPRSRAWQPVQLLMAAAAAACVIGLVGIRHRAPQAAQGAPMAVSTRVPVRAVADTADFSPSPDAMRAVFLTRLPAPDQAQGELISAVDASSQVAQLNWIGGIHMAPVLPANADFLAGARPDLRASVLSDSQNSRDFQEPTEMAAFRFQR
jgi:hypothetical protein